MKKICLTLLLPLTFSAFSCTTNDSFEITEDYNSTAIVEDNDNEDNPLLPVTINNIEGEWTLTSLTSDGNLENYAINSSLEPNSSLTLKISQNTVCYSGNITRKITAKNNDTDYSFMHEDTPETSQKKYSLNGNTLLVNNGIPAPPGMFVMNDAKTELDVIALSKNLLIIKETKKVPSTYLEDNSIKSSGTETYTYTYTKVSK